MEIIFRLRNLTKGRLTVGVGQRRSRCLLPLRLSAAETFPRDCEAMPKLS
jgi:hypothetical protein